jgi:RNA polymerase sigma factor (sigma-70 family)
MLLALSNPQWHLVAANRGLIFFVLKRLRGVDDFDRDDLASVGLLGLARAVLHHDPARGTLSTIACLSIRHEVLAFVARQRRRRLPVVSLDRPTGDQDEPLSALLPAPAEAGLDLAERLDLDRLLAQLPSRTRAVVRLRFGLDGGPPLDAQGVGARVGLSRQRVHQLVNGAIRRMRRAAGQYAESL